MKKFLQFSGFIAAGLAIAAFIFLMAGSALVYRSGDNASYVPGVRVIFGGEVKTILGTVKYDLAATALIAWILILLAMLVLICLAVLPLLKVKALDKFAGLLTLCGACALLVGGILLFFSKAVYSAANSDVFDNWSLSFPHVFAAILAIAGGVIAALPACLNLLGKNK